jgi:DNA-binding response OmpR family regulator
MPDQVLLIEDDAHIVDLLRLNLHQAGFQVVHSADGRRGLELALQQDFSLVILDLVLPGMDGLAVCREIREAKPALPLIMLTAKSTEMDKILGLENGADDYITKPFSVREMMARIRSLLRRTAALQDVPGQTQIPGNGRTLRIGDLVIEVEKRKVTLHGEVLQLTAKEFDLLLLFASHPGRVFSRAELLDLVWGYAYDGYDHTVNSHINRLRSKIEHDASQPSLVRTVWGVGYRFAEPEELVTDAD